MRDSQLSTRAIREFAECAGKSSLSASAERPIVRIFDQRLNRFQANPLGQTTVDPELRGVKRRVRTKDGNSAFDQTQQQSPGVRLARDAFHRAKRKSS